MDRVEHLVLMTEKSPALALAELPDEIRGYGHVKERNASQAAVRREALLRQYREGSNAVRAA